MTEETRSRRYAFVNVDGPGRERVRGNEGTSTKFASACATSMTLKTR